MSDPGAVLAALVRLVVTCFFKNDGAVGLGSKTVTVGSMLLDTILLSREDSKVEGPLSKVFGTGSMWSVVVWFCRDDGIMSGPGSKAVVACVILLFFL